MFMLKGMLRAESQERVLVYLLVREWGYASNIAEILWGANQPITKAVGSVGGGRWVSLSVGLSVKLGSADSTQGMPF